MKGIVQDTYGSPDVLRLTQIDTPLIGDDEMLVRVHAAGVDQDVWHLMAGLAVPGAHRGRRAARAQQLRARL